MSNATQAFNILLLSGAGSGAIYLLRWFWWRINAWTEIIAMIVAATIAVLFTLVLPDEYFTNDTLDVATVKLLLATLITTITWILTTFLTKPEPEAHLRKFYARIQPGGPGWKHIVNKMSSEEIDKEGPWEVPYGLLCVLLGCFGIYSALFSIGNFVFGNVGLGFLLAIGFAIATYLLFRFWSKLNIRNS